MGLLLLGLSDINTRLLGGRAGGTPAARHPTGADIGSVASVRIVGGMSVMTLGTGDLL